MCSYNCIRYLLVIFNVLVWLLGVVLLGVGIWLRVDKDILDYLSLVSLDRDDPFLDYAAYFLIVVGSILFTIGLVGCCGAFQESSCLLSTYSWILILILIAELVTIILVGIFRTRVEIYLKDAMTRQIKYGYMGNRTIAFSWDIMQMRLECCGGAGPKDYVDSVWYNSSNAQAGGVQILHVPITCCVLKEKVLSPSDAEPESFVDCQVDAVSNRTTSRYMHKKGCHPAMIDWIRTHTGLILGVAVIVALIEVFGIVGSCYVMKKIVRDDHRVKPR